MAPHEVHLKVRESLGWNRDLGEFSEPGGDAVHDFAIACDAVYVLVRAQHSRARIV